MRHWIKSTRSLLCLALLALMIGAVGWSDPSPKPQQVESGNPRDLTAASGPGVGEVTLTWTPAPDAAFHWVWSAQSGMQDSNLHRAESAGSAVISDLKPGQEYWFIVIAATAADPPRWTGFSDWVKATAGSSSGIEFHRFPPAGPVRGVVGDYWADVIIGKPDFSQIGPNRVVPFKLFNPAGVIVDRSVSPGRAYIWDSGNSRIVGIDLAKCYATESPCSADLIIGQPAPFDHSACNGDSGVQNFPSRSRAGPDTLCGIPDVSQSPWEHLSAVTMAVDGEGNLYVPDSFNNRVLKYESPFENDSIADEVWGQRDFAAIMCNEGDFGAPNAQTLCFHSESNRFEPGWYGNGTDIDDDGNLWVADGGNNRVLRFPANPNTGVIAKSADLVLGQADFTSGKPGATLDRMHSPSATRVDSQGYVHVVDTDNDRVLVFEPPLESGMSATRTFGSQFRNPTSLELDPSGRGVWVNDTENLMVELWDWAGSEVVGVLGKESYQPDGRCSGSPSTTIDGVGICQSVGGIGIDALGNALVSAHIYTQDVIRFPTRIWHTETGMVSKPDKRLFHPPGGFNFMDRKSLRNPHGVATWGDQLIVSDTRGLLYWNWIDGLTNGAPADGVVGDEFWQTPFPHCCGRIKVDAAGRLWVLSFNGNDFIDVYQLPMTDSSAPVHTLWPRDVSFPVLGTKHRITLGGHISGLAPVERGEYLWLSDTDNHRVLRIREPLVNPVVDVILGQVDPGGTKCNRRAYVERFSHRNEDVYNAPSADMLCFPGALSVDRFGNLYVSDHALEAEGNHRLLVFPRELTPFENIEPIFAPAATKVFETHGGPGFNLQVSDWERRKIIDNTDLGPVKVAAFEAAFNSQNDMAVGYNMYLGGRFVGVYDDPLGENRFPSGYLYDLASMAHSGTFDDNDNFYVSDLNRGRVLVYWNPLNAPRQPKPQPEPGAPLGDYPINIRDVSPKPPYCVLRESHRGYRTMVEFAVNAIPAQGKSLELRRVTGAYRDRIRIPNPAVNVGNGHITVDMDRIGSGLWRDREKVVLITRIVDEDRMPISNWSPAFLLADDPDSCGSAATLRGTISRLDDADYQDFQNIR